MKRWLGALGIGILAATALALALAPGAIERRLQGVLPHDLHRIEPAAGRLHDGLVVADWHADSLLWGRDLLEQSDRGHVDVPRLQAGNVAIQVFTVVTKSPRGQNYASNAADSDNITPLVVLQLWPPRTWTSVRERALYQAERLRDAAERASGRLALVRSADDLRRLLAARPLRPAGERPVAAVLGLEGAHALEGSLEAVDALYAAGFRVVALHHFFDNELGGSLHGQSGEGLTEFGRAVVRRLEELRMIVDLAHSSPAVVDDVLAMATRPVVVSHTGMRSACDSPRNLDDARMRRIAEAGGLVGIGYWEGAVCDASPDGVVRSIRRAIDLLGASHVALGSDFDGTTWTAFDTSELAVLTDAMLRQGFSEREIRAVMGGSSARFLLQHLPEREA